MSRNDDPKDMKLATEEQERKIREASDRILAFLRSYEPQISAAVLSMTIIHMACMINGPDEPPAEVLAKLIRMMEKNAALEIPLFVDRIEQGRLTLEAAGFVPYPETKH
jgi:hypothetical protein